MLLKMDGFFDRNIRESMVAEFLGINKSEVREKMKNATANLSKEWDGRANRFYTRTYYYVFELEEWHIEDKMKQAGIVAIGSQAKGKVFLEYGCGIADTSIVAFYAGANKVYSLDLSSITLKYAKFRSKKFEVEVDFMEANKHISDLILPKVDIVSAEDVFEHVHNPEEHAAKIYNSLNSGGVLYFSTEFVHNDLRPMHLKTNEKYHGLKWLYKLEDIGYKIVSPCCAIKIL